ncbi:MAG TPA: class I SAM-dependent methyltransferase [Blastocatellia bacterium]|nr:class I SAM-dependent methyltransferase [Blastocatellia bacterium]
MNAQTQAKASGCGVCGATTVRELYTARDRLDNSGAVFTIAECEGCGIFRTLPEMTDTELAAFYPDEYWGGEPTEDWIRSSQSEKAHFLSRCESRGGRILDVGCGAGFFLRALDEGRWERFGIEIGKVASEQAARSLGDDHVSAGTLIEKGFDDSYFDVVTFWSALEHTNEPRANLIEARRILKPGRTLIVQVPNVASYQSRWFEGDWFALDAPRHRYHFSARTLDRLLAETGFETYRRTFSSKAHNSHSLRQSLKTRMRGEGSSRLSRAFFYLAIPVIKPFDLAMTALDEGATLTVAARAV